MDYKKIPAVNEWPDLDNVHDIQCFLDFANFYPRITKSSSNICKPLFTLLKKEEKFIFYDEAEAAFPHLQAAFTVAPILQHFDLAQSISVATDASDHVYSTIISQPVSEGHQRLCISALRLYRRVMTRVLRLGRHQCPKRRVHNICALSARCVRHHNIGVRMR